MQNLKETLESFSLSEDTWRKILNEDHPFGNQGNPFIPSEFKEIAQIALAGHFLVTAGAKQVTVQPTCVEFYYHEEAEGGIKDPIVYHRNPQNGSPKSIFWPFSSYFATFLRTSASTSAFSSPSTHLMEKPSKMEACE